MWAMSCDLKEEQKAPAVVLQLGGLAREIARDLNPESLQNGEVMDYHDGRGGQQRTGIEVLLRGLALRFAPLEVDVEVATQAVTALFQFRKRQGEAIDDYLTRFDLTRYRAAELGKLELPPTGYAHMLLTSLGISAETWISFLQPFQGNLPTNDAEFKQLLAHIRRQGHMFERGGIAQAQRQHVDGTYVGWQVDPMQAQDPWAASSASSSFMGTPSPYPTWGPPAPAAGQLQLPYCGPIPRATIDAQGEEAARCSQTVLHCV